MRVPVLLVDDDQSIQKTVEIILQNKDFNLIPAHHGHGALHILEEGFKGVILLDIMMPGMDGWKTLETMVERQLIQGCVVCMLTAVCEPGDAMDPLKEYVADYLRKPFTHHELLQTLSDLVDYLP